jgi:hypothetical protein
MMQNLYNKIVECTKKAGKKAFGLVGLNRRKPFKHDYHIRKWNSQISNLEKILQQEDENLVNCSSMISLVSHCTKGNISHNQDPLEIKNIVRTALKGIRKCVYAREKKLKGDKISKANANNQKNFQTDPKRFFSKHRRPTGSP